jgi:hypothetical protein
MGTSEAWIAELFGVVDRDGLVPQERRTYCGARPLFSNATLKAQAGGQTAWATEDQASATCRRCLFLAP